MSKTDATPIRMVSGGYQGNIHFPHELHTLNASPHKRANEICNFYPTKLEITETQILNIENITK
jgi:hypothetical protein